MRSASSADDGGGSSNTTTSTSLSSLLLPWWLRATAERETAVGGARVRGSLVPERTVRRETCSVENTEDGFALLHCQEQLERFRLCADGQMELIESSTSTSVRPYGEGGPEAPQGGSGRYDDVAHSPIVAATLGQMLDDFFAFAGDLHASLQAAGVDTDSVRRELEADAAAVNAAAAGGVGGSSSSQAAERMLPRPVSLVAAGNGNGSSLRSLFDWWQRWQQQQQQQSQGLLAAVTQQQQQQQQPSPCASSTERQ